MSGMVVFPRARYGRLPTGVHYAMWPALGYRGGRGHRATAHGYVGIPVRVNVPPLIRLGTTCARQSVARARTHYVKSAAIVWRAGQPVTLGARWWCGQMTAQAQLLEQPAGPVCLHCAAALATHLGEG